MCVCVYISIYRGVNEIQLQGSLQLSSGISDSEYPLTFNKKLKIDYLELWFF